MADSADLVLLRGSAWSCGRYWLSLQRLSASITILLITTPLETVVVKLLIYSLYTATAYSTTQENTRSVIKNPHTLTSQPADSDSASDSTYPKKYGPHVQYIIQ